MMTLLVRQETFATGTCLWTFELLTADRTILLRIIKSEEGWSYKDMVREAERTAHMYAVKMVIKC
jgi:hypothetical protein